MSAGTGGVTLAAFAGPEGQWGRGRLPRMKPSSRRTAERALARDILPRFGGSDLAGIAAADVTEWFEALAERGAGGASRTLSVLRAILRYAVSLELIERDPTRHCRPVPSRRCTRWLDRAELDRLHAELDAYRGRCGDHSQADIIRLLLLTGCRAGEIIRLRWDEVDGSALRLADSKTGPRTVWLCDEARAILDCRPRPRISEWVFPDRRDPRRHRSPDLCAWQAIRRRAGIPDVRIHDLRHTYASQAVMSGVPLPIVSRLLGHSSIQMTMRYAHAGDRETQAAADRIGAALLGVAEGAA